MARQHDDLHELCLGERALLGVADRHERNNDRRPAFRR
jgi:hypothetical protein